MKVRKLLRLKKVGHSGTLDPGVEGVLPICIGEATKIIPFLSSHKKVYVADVYLGTSTTTEDSEGDIVLEKEVTTPPTDEEIADVLSRFTGEITQIPPMYSAVKVNGKKLYEYARENKQVERPKRKITVHQIERIHTREGNNPFRIEVTCSKGTYIRTLCVDIGEALGYPAHMSYLLRTESDSFTMDDTLTFSQLEEAVHAQTVSKLLFPVERVLSHLHVVHVNDTMRQRILNGQKLSRHSYVTETNEFVMMHDGKLLAIYGPHETNEQEIKPIRVFNMHKRA